jgi:hypothetical protein
MSNIVVVADDNLRGPRVIAHVDERDSTMISTTRHPSGERDSCSSIGES